MKGLVPTKDKSLHVRSGARCGVDTSKAHPGELGESSAETTSFFVQRWLWAGNCPLSTTVKQILLSTSTVSLQAFWIFNNTICLPRNRAWRSLNSYWYRRWAGGLWWCGAGWPVTPLQEHPQTVNPSRWLWAEDVAGKRDHAGGFRHQSGGLERKRKCWAGIKWPWHVVRGKPETCFPLTYKSLAQIQATAVYFTEWQSWNEPHHSSDPKVMFYWLENWDPEYNPSLKSHSWLVAKLFI